MFALEESAPSLSVCLERNAGYVAIRMTADDVRRLTGQSQEIRHIHDAELSKEGAVAGGNFEQAFAAAQVSIDQEQPHDHAGRRQKDQGG
jgi:hypothetical protein